MMKMWSSRLQEVKEELGLEVRIRAFAGVLRIRFEYENERVMFYSFIFILDEVGGRLLADASDDEISEIREVDLDEFERMVRRLAALKANGRIGKVPVHNVKCRIELFEAKRVYNRRTVPILIAKGNFCK